MTSYDARETADMEEPGVDEYGWETRWQELEPQVADSPRETLPELDELLSEMLTARGFERAGHPADRAAAETAEPETVRDLAEARRITALVDAGETVDPGDVGLAVEAYRNLYHYLRGLGPSAGAPV